MAGVAGVAGAGALLLPGRVDLAFEEDLGLRLSASCSAIAMASLSSDAASVAGRLETKAWAVARADGVEWCNKYTSFDAKPPPAARPSLVVAAAYPPYTTASPYEMEHMPRPWRPNGRESAA